MFYIFGFYKFKKLTQPLSFKEELNSILKMNSARGSIIISTEGLNGIISGEKKNILKIIQKIKKFYNFKNFDSQNSSMCSFQPFHKSKIKIKKEVVPIGTKLSKINKKKTYIEANKWNSFLRKVNIKIIDARKPFEYNMGTFKGAENPNIDNFRDFPNYLKKINKKKPIAMFCTGGIRCEKATNYLVKKGYKKVYQLKGGIINYLKNINIKSSLWSGECYVFDNRVSLKHKLKLGTFIICSGCRKPVSKDEKKSKKYQMGISCPKCYDKLSISQKERFAMRQKQILLAKKMGKNYLFKKEYYWGSIGK